MTGVRGILAALAVSAVLWAAAYAVALILADVLTTAL